MAEQEGSSRDAALARLAQSRAEIKHILEPAPRRAHGDRQSGADDAAAGRTENFSTFPRSRTMRLLMSGRGMGTAGAVVGGLLLARPALALRLFRLLPVSAVARMLLIRAIASFRARA